MREFNEKAKNKRIRKEEIRNWCYVQTWKRSITHIQAMSISLIYFPSTYAQDLSLSTKNRLWEIKTFHIYSLFSSEPFFPIASWWHFVSRTEAVFVKNGNSSHIKFTFGIFFSCCDIKTKIGINKIIVCAIKALKMVWIDEWKNKHNQICRKMNKK